MRVHFILICEGSSDHGLIPHLERLCIDAGADEVTGAAPDFARLPEPVGHTLQARLRAVMTLEPGANLIIVHRDADSTDEAPRIAEISSAVGACLLVRPWVPVVPVQETEAWLLLDEAAIRRIAGRPHGRGELNLPRPAAVEGVTRPKERLLQALVIAAEVTGRRREKFSRDFPRHRRLLLRWLPVGGVLEQVPAWVRLRDDLRRAIAALQAAEATPE